ncbi:MAG: ABC transporter ATP-binding protein [Planctomycetales bacterium]|nr:ABC transporter ATP-binding protein [Planctomycetales bacterium]
MGNKATSTKAGEPLLRVEDLHVGFDSHAGLIPAVAGVSFDLRAGETLGIVGESGSGKSITNLAILGLVPKPAGRITGGRIVYQGRDLVGLPNRDLSKIRGHKIAMIFQDPMTALNPFLTIADQMTEVTRLHLGFSQSRALEHAIEMLARVGISNPADRVQQYPHEFSGGMRQRVMIAMALSCQPDILIADEPTTALDVTIQAQILDLMKDLQREQNTAIILITHDLGVVANVCQRVLVMYAGKIVERAEVEPLFTRPRHPYTEGLLKSVPRWDEHESSLLKAIEGQPPLMSDLPSGCSFRPRCPYAFERCEREEPPLFPRADWGEYACFADIETAVPHAPTGREAAASTAGQTGPEEAS